MKRLILSAVVLALFIMGLSIVDVNASWAGDFADGRISYFSEDPNEVVPESWFTDYRISYLSEDPNDDDNPDEGVE